MTVDFETNGTHPLHADLVGVGVHTDRGCGYYPLSSRPSGAGLSHSGGYEPASCDALDGRKQLIRATVELPIIGWNLPFDLTCLERVTGVKPTVVVDAMVAYWLLNEEASFALKTVLETLTMEEQEDFKVLLARSQDLLRERTEDKREAWVQAKHAMGMKKTEARKLVASTIKIPKACTWDIPQEWLAPYCVKDAVATSWIWFNVLLPALKAEGLLEEFFTYEMPFLLVLWKMETRGIGLDLSKLEREDKELEIHQTRTDHQASAIAGREINLNSVQQLQTYLFDDEGLTPSNRVTKTGAPSLDEDALKELSLAYPENQFLRLLLEFRNICKNRSFAQNLMELAINGRAHTRYKQVGAATGRLASSEPNLQNLPTKTGIRAAFVATPGYAIIKADYAQAELRIMADRSRDPLLLENYRRNGDLHTLTQERLGLADRRVAKKINFGQLYGMGGKLLQQQLFFEGITRSLEECQQDIENYYKTYEGINPWKEEVIAEGQRLGYVTTRLGRRRRLPFTSTSWNERSYAERQGVNCLIQGDVADLMRVAMIELAQEFLPWDAHLLLQVHDELVCEAPLEVVYEVARLVQRVMEGVLPGSRVPIIADVGVGPSWGETEAIDTDPAA